ncbi:MAG: hypothetical protein MUO26_05070 [Methanotrichaceae archaeon]|nr:hypothetical protein [Methanotrichaceae archaeon]
MVTATDITIEHYQRPEVQEIIAKFAMLGDGAWRALNGDFHRWYRYSDNDQARLLNAIEDYDHLTSQFRTLYQTLNVFDPSLWMVGRPRDEITSDNPLGTPADTVAYTLGVDIDKGHGCEIEILETREAVESAAQFLVDYLKERGIHESVWNLFSGGGIYVEIHHEICRPKSSTSENRQEFFEKLTDRYNRFIAHVSEEFFKKHPEHAGKVKFDALNNSKRVFKCILSVHRSKPYAVTPLNRDDIKIDLERAHLPLREDMIAEAREWYSTYDPAERESLLKLLDEFKEDKEKKQAAHHFKEIWRSPTKIEAEKFPPCIKHIIDKENPSEGKTRCTAILSTFLYQMGWDEEEAWILVKDVSDRNDLDNAWHIFESCYGRINCPSCDTIKNDATGYPHLGLKGIWACPAECLSQSRKWPGDYNYNSSSKNKKHSKAREILADLNERIKEDPGIVYESEIFDALQEIYETDPREWERIKKILRTNKISSRDLIAAFKDEIEEITITETPFIKVDNKLAEMVVQDGVAKFAVYDMTTGDITYVPELLINSTRVVPPWNDKVFVKGYIILPSKAEEYGDELALYEEIKTFIHKYVDVSPGYESIAAFYPMVTWVYDVMAAILYLRVKGDWVVGKSRFLDTFRVLCYRAIAMTGAMSEAPIFRLLEKWFGTPILDEADYGKNDTAANAMEKILICGFERNKPIYRCDTDDPKCVDPFDPFGPKVIATRYEFRDKALESRCFTEVLKETNRNLPELGPEFYEEGQRLRNKLLMYRFRSRTKIQDRVNKGIVKNFDITGLPKRIQQAAKPISIVIADHPLLLAQLKSFLEEKVKELVLEAAETIEGHLIDFLAGIPPIDKNLRIDGDSIEENVYFLWDVRYEDVIEPIKNSMIINKLSKRKVMTAGNSLGLKTHRSRIGNAQKRRIICEKTLFDALKSRYIPSEIEPKNPTDLDDYGPYGPDADYWNLYIIWDYVNFERDDGDDSDARKGGGHKKCAISHVDTPPGDPTLLPIFYNNSRGGSLSPLSPLESDAQLLGGAPNVASPLSPLSPPLGNIEQELEDASKRLKDKEEHFRTPSEDEINVRFLKDYRSRDKNLNDILYEAGKIYTFWRPQGEGYIRNDLAEEVTA